MQNMQKKDSRDLRGSALIKYKKTLKLTNAQKDIIVGTTLGDASITKTAKEPNIKFEQGLAKAEYIDHLYENLANFVGTPPRLREIRGGGAKDRQSVWFRTYRHPCFNFYYNLFYPQTEQLGRRIKRVPKFIHRLLTPSALAYWFMDDGTYNENKNKTSRGYYLSTQSFPLSDQKILQRALKTNFNIQTNIHKDRAYYKLFILAESKQLFVNVISPYILPCFYYKLEENCI